MSVFFIKIEIWCTLMIIIFRFYNMAELIMASGRSMHTEIESSKEFNFLELCLVENSELYMVYEIIKTKRAINLADVEDIYIKGRSKNPSRIYLHIFYSTPPNLFTNSLMKQSLTIALLVVINLSVFFQSL